MDKSILNEEITRIREMMGITSKLILESIPPAKLNLKSLLDTVFGIKNVADADAPGFFKEKMKELGTQGIKFSDNRITGMFNNQLEPIKEFIINQKQVGRSANDVKNAIESNYRELFDEDGVFKGYIDELYNSMASKVKEKLSKGVDEILVSNDFNNLIKNTKGGNQYKDELRKNWDKRYGWIFAEKEINQTTIDTLIAKIKSEYPIKSTKWDRIMSTTLGKILKRTVGNTYVRFALVACLVYRMYHCRNRARRVKGESGSQVAERFGYCLTKKTLEDIASLTGVALGIVWGGLSAIIWDDIENNEIPTIDSPQVTDSPEGWRDYCKRLEWVCTVDDDGSYRTNDYSYYKYSGTTPNGTFVFDTETTDVKRDERKAEKVRRDTEAKRKQQQGGTQQGGTENGKKFNIDDF